MSYVLNTPQDIAQLESFLQGYTEDPQTQMNYESREKYKEQINKSMHSMLLIGSLLSMVIGMIALLNFINSFLTSIHARQMEFAMMRSIGMTKRQLLHALMVESGMYFILSLIAALITGFVVSVLLLKPLISGIWFATFKLTLMPILYVSPLLATFSMVIPVAAYIDIKKSSIIEMLREAS